MANKESSIAVKLDTNEISNAVANICSECYGVVGLANFKTTKNKTVELKNDNNVQGIVVKKEKYGFSLEIHLICAYGVKITEIVNEVSKRITFALKRKYGELFNKVSVFVEEVRDV
jgi:uncharacterized alkaline shock family protein YloU